MTMPRETDESLTLDFDARARAQKALSELNWDGKVAHFCEEWIENPDDGCSICWEISADVIRAAEGLKLCPTCNGTGDVGGGAHSCCDDCGGNGLAALND